MSPSPRLVGTLVLALVLTPILGSLPPDAAAVRVVLDTFELDVGDPVFWDGPELVGGTDANYYLQFADAPCELTLCFDYRLVVAEGGSRLRVALDVFEDRGGDDGQWWLYLFDPDGRIADLSFTSLGFQFRWSLETFAYDPPPGDWIVRIATGESADGEPRLRAKLEGRAQPAIEPTALLPDLQHTPPYQIGFYGAPLFLPNSCSSSEMTDYGATRCLRFSNGPVNVGEGTFQLLYSPDDDLDGQLELYQRIRHSDGTFLDRPAGTVEFHAMHGHYHTRALGDVRLYHVGDETTGALEEVARGPKIGFCVVDVYLTPWESFLPDESGTADSDCGAAYPDAGTMGISSGWGDLYLWSNEANFVDLGEHGDGAYVLSIVDDPEDVFLEANEDDNAAYAYFTLEGETVTVIERGRGAHPWDPTKEIVEVSAGSSLDVDGDGLSDADEVTVYGTDPVDPDTDDDGLLDGEEVHAYGTHPNEADTDGDYDPYPEYFWRGPGPYPYHGTPGEFLSDGEEVALGTDPLRLDSDGDRLWDGNEVVAYGTDPTNPDTDRDGPLDWVELACGTDPTHKGKRPNRECWEDPDAMLLEPPR